jgi:ferritin-like metal-binding protein YciE
MRQPRAGTSPARLVVNKEATMPETIETLREYVNDMLAVERDIHSALRRHKDDRGARTYPVAAAVLQTIEDRVDVHVAGLERCLERIGDGESTVKAAVGAVLGAVAGVYGKLRDDRVSRMLRDDYTALCFACVCYEMLHTTALALGHREIAELAIEHLRDYTPAVMALGEVLPEVVTDELQREGKVFDSGPIARVAAENTRDAWRVGDVAQTEAQP